MASSAGRGALHPAHRENEVDYFRTPEGNKVDFHAVDAAGNAQLIQVCANASDPATLQREVRFLVKAKARHPEMTTRPPVSPPESSSSRFATNPLPQSAFEGAHPPSCQPGGKDKVQAYPQRTEWNVRDSDGTVVFTFATIERIRSGMEGRNQFDGFSPSDGAAG